MKKILCKSILLSIIFFTSVIFASDFAVCQRVVDGDTIVLNDGRKVRLIGVDTPESKHPNKPVEYFSKEAADYLTKQIEGKPIRLEYDSANAGRNNKGKYGRTLAYVYNDGKLINKEIIKNGYGRAYTKYPYDTNMKSEFYAAEIFARESGKGMWKNNSEPKSENILISMGKSFFAGLTGQNSTKTVKYKSTGESSITETDKIYNYVLGYTRADGTRVKGYWRRKRNFNKSSSGKTYVRGYTRKNGTKVRGYYRSKRSGAGGKGKIYVSGNTRSNGTKVHGYWRSRPNRSYSSGGSSSGSRSGGSGKVSVRGYTRSNGTYVHGYTRSAPSRRK